MNLMTSAPPSASRYDLIVVGAGSGGVRAARVAAGHGARVALIEEHRVGGTCVIRGCVPKKLLVYGAHFAEDLRDARQFGWDVPPCRFDWPVLRDRVLGEVSRLEGLYRSSLTSAGVELIDGRAQLVDARSVVLDDGRLFQADRILLAIGAWPARPDCPGAEFGITSNEVFHLETLPRRILIAGGGYIANEFAGIFNELGAEVTLMTRGDTILRGYDAELCERLQDISVAKGISFRFHATFERIEKLSDGSLVAHMTGQEPIAADAILFAVGRIPKTSGMGLEAAGVTLDTQGAIRIDAQYQTSLARVFAVGDVTNRVQLTPVAIREGQCFADTQFGGTPSEVDYEHIPCAVFSHPPMAGVGLTEAGAHALGRPVKIFRSSFKPMKNVLAGRDERALYKMIVDAGTNRVLGIHMIGPDAPEILQVAAVAVKAGLTKAAFDQTIALHPSMAEELVLLR